jgi:hypothetical protein
MKLHALLLTLLSGTMSAEQHFAYTVPTEAVLLQFLLDHPRKPVNFFSIPDKDSYTSGNRLTTYKNNDGVIEVTCVEQDAPEILSDSQLEARKNERGDVFGNFMTDQFTSTEASFDSDEHNKNLVTETTKFSTKIDTAFYKNLQLIHEIEKDAKAIRKYSNSY